MILVSTIFQVEDDADFSFIMEHALKEINKNIKIVVSTNGSDAIVQLNKYKENNEAPSLILLDINLQGLSGIDILKIIREMSFFDLVPVVIFSTSDNPKDIKIALEFGATEFCTKPLGYDELVKSLEMLYAKYLNL